MGVETKISWSDATWTPVSGCSRTSDACRSCYAEELSLRRGWSTLPWTDKNAAENVKLHPDRLRWPVSWTEPKRVFVTSMGDLFHEEVPEDFILTVFGIMAGTPRHTYQVLTKRTARMAELLSKWTKADVAAAAERYFSRGKPRLAEIELARRASWPLPNVWAGTTLENRKVMERLSHLEATPAVVRWLSCEPLLDDIANDLRERVTGPWLHWIIAGGESGPRRRPMDMEWARRLRDFCEERGVAYFYKQGNGSRAGEAPYLIEHDGTRRAYRQFPGDLREPAEVLP